MMKRQLGADGRHAVIIITHGCAVVCQGALVEAETFHAFALFGADIG
jgi:hypothetical protein